METFKTTIIITPSDNKIVCGNGGFKIVGFKFVNPDSASCLLKEKFNENIRSTLNLRSLIESSKKDYLHVEIQKEISEYPGKELVFDFSTSSEDLKIFVEIETKGNETTFLHI